MNILQDVKTAVAVLGEVRRARKTGCNGVQVKPVYTVPCFTFNPSFYNTIEGCTIWKCGREADRAVMEVFRSLPYETRRQLERTPDDSRGWVERAQFWQRELRPALPSAMYHKVMVALISWYAHCLRRRKGLGVQM